VTLLRPARRTFEALVGLAWMAGCVDSHPVVFVGGEGGQGQMDSGGGAGQANDGEADAALAHPCMAIPVARELITDFSDAHPATLQGLPDIEFDVQPGMVGGTFTYQQFGQTVAYLSIEPSGADEELRVTAKPGAPINGQVPTFGFGIGWGAIDGQCLDATGYGGLRFTIEGSLSTCQLWVGVNISRDLYTGFNAAGTCAVETQCNGPSTGPLTPNTGTFEARFADMSGGNPVGRVDVTSLSGINWTIVPPLDGSCDARFPVDDVAFIR
jgi:hypothetical protein